MAAYLALFAILGFVAVYRARRDPPSKEALRSTVVWSIRAVATGLLGWSSNSGPPFRAFALNPKPSTLNSKPYTLSPKP